MALPKPVSVALTVISSSRIDLTWGNPTFYNSIEIWRNDGGGWVLHATIGGTLRRFEDSGLEVVTEYCYMLRAVRLYPWRHESELTDSLCETTFAVLVPATDVVATPISDTEIDLTFKDNSASEKWHRVEREISTDPDVWGLVKDLEPNRDFFRDRSHVLTLLSGGYVSCVPSDIGKQVTDDATEIGVLLSYDNATRRWTIDSSTIIADASTIAITDGTGGGTADGASVGIVADSLYTYRVHAQITGNEDENWVEAAQVRTFDLPGIPTLADILAVDTKDKSIRIRWSNVVNETGYRIEMSIGDDSFGADEADLIAVVGADVTDFLITGLTPGESYWFRVRAYNAVGNGTFSDTKTKTTDDPYVPTEFEKWIRDPNIEPVYLAEVYVKMTLETFTPTDGQNKTFQKTIDASDRGIDILEVFEGKDSGLATAAHVAYTLVGDIDAVQATAKTFFFNYATRTLYVHTSDDSDPDTFDLIEGAFWLYFSTHKDIEFNITRGEIERLTHFLPLLAKEDIPDITQEIKPYFEGSFAISSGSIAFMNAKIGGEYFFDEKFATYTWINAKVILKAGRSDFTYDLTGDNKQFKEIFTAYIDSKSCNDKKITFQLRDMRKEMSQAIVLNKYWRTDQGDSKPFYPDMDETHKGNPIPAIFGSRELGVPVPIDMDNQKFKFNDTSASLRSASVEEVRKNSAVLIENTHYYVDLQRSIITFDREGAFVITAGVNDKINFKEGAGGELTATLAEGIYTTAELCAEIESKMEAANSLNFTVTPIAIPAPSPKKFIIAANGEFSLLWKTGTNGADGTDTHVGTTIGFYDEEDGEGEVSYEADEDVITVQKGDIIEVSFTGFVNSADEPIENGAEIFKYLMNTYKGIQDAELDLDSIYATKYAKPSELVLPIESEVSFDEIVRTIEHSMEAYTFQDEFGRLGIKPQQTTVASNVKYIVSEHVFGHGQKKDKSTLFWKVNVYYKRNFNDEWEVETAINDKINWQYKITDELDIYTYFPTSPFATALATSILNLLNKEQIDDELSMLLFDVMAGDLIKFSRTRFYDSDGTASEAELRVIRISKSPASGRTSITTEVK